MLALFIQMKIAVFRTWGPLLGAACLRGVGFRPPELWIFSGVGYAT